MFKIFMKGSLCFLMCVLTQFSCQKEDYAIQQEAKTSSSHQSIIIDGSNRLKSGNVMTVLGN